MLKLFFKKGIKKNLYKQLASIPNGCSTVLLAVFSRYGDGLIAFKIAGEFANKNPNIKFLLVTTHQLLPYAKEFFGNNAIAVNKRNPFELYRTIAKIKQFAPMLGLNPWSFGDEAKFFISYAKHYIDFATFSHWGKEYNLYDRAREYFGLDLPKRDFTVCQMPQDARIILFAPFSTDITKSLSVSDAVKFLGDLQTKYNNATIYLCGFANETAKITHKDVFNFARSKKSSSSFVSLVKSADLFVGVDAGPLHVATALGIKSLAIFGPTAPQTILDSYDNVIIWRNQKLDGVFCFVESCKNPICLKGEFTVSQNITSNVVLTTDFCPLGVS